MQKESATLIQIIDEVVCASLCANTFGKGMNSFVLLNYGERGKSLKAKVMDCSFEVSESVYLPRYYVHFHTNALEKGIGPPSSPPQL